jgi:DNA-binding Lrp family transcriptional regulator
MDDLDRAIVDRGQGGFPISSRPFRDAARAFATTEAVLLDRIARLLAERTLTRFGPLFDVERMGGRFTLAAIAVPNPDFERVAAIVNAFPEVAHNYAREHVLNMWFVLAASSPAATTETIARIEAATGRRVLAFPKEREYFVGMNLGADGARAIGEGGARTRTPRKDVDEHSLDRAIVTKLQAGLTLVPKPYDDVARAIGASPDVVRGRVRTMLADGRIRRIGAVPDHYSLGWRANGMSVWDVDDAEVDALGARVGALPDVTHCYRRPRYLPRWPYNLFAMVHGRDRDEVGSKVDAIAAILGASASRHDVLFSTRILKKSGLRLA